MVGGVGVRDEELGCVTHVLPAIEKCAHSRGCGNPSSVGIGQSQGEQPLPGCDLRQKVLLFLLRAFHQDRQGAQDHRGEERAGTDVVAHLFEEENQIQE